MSTPALITFALSLADDALVLGHRLSEWSSKAPSLEEDIALSNLGLDLIGQARLFYQLAATIEAKGRDEDQFAYFREAADFRCIGLVQLPKGDFAFTMARHLVYAAFVHPYFEALANGLANGVRPLSFGAEARAESFAERGLTPSSQTPTSALAEIASKAVKEMAYHVRHASEWVIRLGDGTVESRRRMIAGLEGVWPYTGELFEMDAEEQSLVEAGIVPDRALIKPRWAATIDRVLAEATLEAPPSGPLHTGGRAGRHTEHLAPMLAEMQSLARAHPGVTW